MHFQESYRVISWMVFFLPSSIDIALEVVSLPNPSLERGLHKKCHRANHANIALCYPQKPLLLTTGGSPSLGGTWKSLEFHRLRNASRKRGNPL